MKKAGVPQATHRGLITIGAVEVECYVLEDGRRVLTQESFLKGMGRAAKAKGGHGVLSAVDDTPAFLAATNLKPLIDKEISASTIPVEFASMTGVKVRGYVAELLPQVCRVYLAARDIPGCLKSSQRHIAMRADILVRALADLGIAALVDEATGYQEVRDRHALQALLDQYLRREHAVWARRFPNEFYQEMFRLKGWKFPTEGGARPGVVGRYTSDVVYARIAPGLVEELEKKNPSEAGQRRTKHHQWLTDDVGHPALSAHLHAVIGFMRASDNWERFKELLDRAFPVKGTQFALLLPE